MDIKSKIEDDIKIISDVVEQKKKDRKETALEMYFIQDSFTFTLSTEVKKFHKRVNEIKEEYDTINEDLEKNKKSLKKLKQRKRRLEEVSNLPPRKRKHVNYKDVTDNQIIFELLERSSSDNRQW
jgi:hypothetical protein